MPQTVFIHDGETVDFTPSVAVAVGDVVVLGDLIGVAKQAIAAGALGSLALTGVYDVNKLGGLALAAGALAYWDDTANVITNVATGNKLFGKTVRAALAADATVRVRLGS